MSKTAVDQVIRKAIGDASFRARLHSDPGTALTGFDLTKDERSAITSGDPKRLTALGVDQRMSKAFDLGGQTGAVSKVISPELSGIAAKAIVDEGGMNAMNLRRIEGDLNVSAARTPADVSGDFNRLDEGTVSSGTAARVPDGTTSLNAMNLRRIEGDLNVGAARTPADVSGDFNRLDEGLVSPTDAAITEGAGFGPSRTAFEPADVSGDFNRLDEGIVSGSDATRATDTAATDALQAPSTGLDQGAHNIAE